MKKTPHHGSGTSASKPDFDLDLLILLSMEQIARGADFETYRQRISAVSEGVFPGRGLEADDVAAARRLVNLIARSIWKRCPHPAHRYAAAPLPAVERNAPCHCGSGRKYKQCCQPMEAMVPPLDMNWLAQLIEAMPRKRWKELAGSRVPIDMVIDLAVQWHEADRHAWIVALLEPWFADDAHFVQRCEPLLALLLDAYTDAGKPRKKSVLLERALANGDAAIRSSAQQRLATMVADEGDFGRAWSLFQQAQRAAPDDPSLSHLEVILLLSEGRETEARERARFWLVRLARKRDVDLAGLLDFLRSVAIEGPVALDDMAGRMDPNVAAFRRLWNEAPPIAALYVLDADGDSAGPLVPVPALSRVLLEWEQCTPAMDYSPFRRHEAGWWEGALQWLGALERHPLLWNAFEVLDGLVEALLAIPVGNVGARLARPLLERAEALLRENLRANGALSLKLEWGWHENRPALNLIGHLIASSTEDEPDDATLARMEWLVGTLNPDDNLGIRFALMRALLSRGRFEEAVALSDRYPDDFASMRYNRALALYASGRLLMASAALRDAAAHYPQVLKYLLAENPRPVKADAMGVQIGGKYEAWKYRQEHLDLWQRHAALDWARTGTGVRARGRR